MKSTTNIAKISSLLVLLFFAGCNQASPAEPANPPSGPAHAQLAYVVDLGMNSQVYISNLLDSRQATAIEGDARGLHWSPNGQYLAWVAYQHSTSQSSLWVIDADKIVTSIVPWTTDLLTYRWSPDSERILVLQASSNSANDKILAYTLFVSTQQPAPTWFESFPFHEFANVTISPDWQYIAYVQDDDSILTVRNQHGKTWNIHTLPSSTHRFKSLVWSPDGQWLGFSTGDIAQTQVFISRPNGEQFQELSPVADASGGYPIWSPDSQWLAYRALNQDYAHTQIFISHPASQQLLELEPVTGIASNLTWSHSSSRLAFTLMDADDANQLCYLDIQTLETAPHCLQAVWAGEKLAWLSDDEWILATNRVDKQWDIYRMLLSGKTSKNLTQSDEIESDLALWIPD